MQPLQIYLKKKKKYCSQELENIQRKIEIYQMENLKVAAVRKAVTRRNSSHKSDTNHVNKLREV